MELCCSTTTQTLYNQPINTPIFINHLMFIQYIDNVHKFIIILYKFNINLIDSRHAAWYN